MYIEEDFKFDWDEYNKYTKGVIQEIHEEYDNRILILKDVLRPKALKREFNGMYRFLEKGFEVDDVRHYKIKFKIDQNDTEVREMTVCNMITNLIMLKPFMQLKAVDELDETYLFDCSNITNGQIEKYINSKIIEPHVEDYSIRKLNVVLEELRHNLPRPARDFNVIMGLSIDYETFIQLANEDPVIAELMQTKVDDTKQPSEVEAELDKKLKLFIERICKTDNMLTPILQSGTGMKDKQLEEFAVNGGYKPDITGNTMPIPINGNFIRGGLNNITNYYIDACGGVKALIANKIDMGPSGYFARLVKMIATTVELDLNVEDCGSVHPVKYEIKSKKHLDMLVGRWYHETYSREYKLLKSSDTHLIGDTIYVRDPATCACHDGKVCKRCYGALWRINKNINIGNFAATKVTKPVQQNVLSTKHLLTTISIMLKFMKEFDTFFKLKANEICINDSSEIDLGRFNIIIYKENLHKINEFDDEDYNMYLYAFGVEDTKTGTVLDIVEETRHELFLSPEFYRIVKDKMKHTRKEFIKFPMDKLYDKIVNLGMCEDEDSQPEARLFITQIENNELTKPLYSIMHLLNRADRTELGVYTVDDMCNKFLDLLIESKIKVRGVHASTILRSLVRAKNGTESPKFDEYNPKYELMTVNSALESYPSATLGISHQQLKRQLRSPRTFNKRKGSYIDPFFRKTLIH